MGTVPTGEMERELRKQYLQWLAGLDQHRDDLPAYIDVFQKRSRATIAKFGGYTASLGAPASFPAPKLLELSPVANVVYDQMKQTAIQAGIMTGLNSRDVARQMLNAGLDKSYRRLERLARTETVSAYWKNQWDSVADLPAIVMVWGSEESKRTCQYCLSRDGLVVEDSQIRDHPNGRCTLIPTLRSQVKYKGTLEPDGSVTMDPRWSEQRVAGAKAKKSAGPTTEAQRDPLSGKSNPAALSTAQPVHQSAPTAPSSLPAIGADGVRRGGLPTPPQSAMDALRVGGKAINTDLVKATRKAMHATPDGAALERTLTAFQQGGARGIPLLRTDIEKYLSGSTELAAGRVETIQRLLGAINANPVPELKLWRGMSIPGTADDVLARYAAGSKIDMSLGSFSDQKGIAQSFAMDPAGKKVRTKGNTPVIMEYVGDDRTAVPLQNLGGVKYAGESEWITAGQFEVESARKGTRAGQQVVLVTIRRVAKW